MPIYAYRCDSCGATKDVLQKVSDAPLTVCPECGAASFRKALTAPAFQLKGSGWYVTDFRNNGGKPAGGTAPEQSGGGAGASGSSASSSASTPAASGSSTPTPSA